MQGVFLFCFSSPKSGLNLKREAVHGHGVLHKDMNYEWKVFEKVILDEGWSFMRVVLHEGFHCTAMQTLHQAPCKSLEHTQSLTCAVNKMLTVMHSNQSSNCSPCYHAWCLTSALLHQTSMHSTE